MSKNKVYTVQKLLETLQKLLTEYPSLADQPISLMHEVINPNCQYEVPLLSCAVVDSKEGVRNLVLIGPEWEL